MHAPALLLAAALVAAARAERAPAAPENPLAAPARCVLRYLEAVRLAGPRPALAPSGRPLRANEREYVTAKRLTAPRTLQDIERGAARREVHALAPWQEGARLGALESFQLLAARRAPRGASVVTVKERFWRTVPGAGLEVAVSEYLVARVDGEWKVIHRLAGAAFDDQAVAAYAGYFDDPGAEEWSGLASPGPGRPPPPAARQEGGRRAGGGSSIP